MSQYVVRGAARGLFYSGPSLKVALATLAREIHECLVMHQGPTDARLYCDGKPVETGLQLDGTLQVIPELPPQVLPSSEVPRKYPG